MNGQENLRCVAEHLSLPVCSWNWVTITDAVAGVVLGCLSKCCIRCGSDIAILNACHHSWPDTALLAYVLCVDHPPQVRLHPSASPQGCTFSCCLLPALQPSSSRSTSSPPCARASSSCTTCGRRSSWTAKSSRSTTCCTARSASTSSPQDLSGLRWVQRRRQIRS